MTFRVRFTETAQEDLERLQDVLPQQSNGDWALAEHALQVISAGITVLQLSPFSCRDARTVTVLAVRDQREDDFH